MVSLFRENGKLWFDFAGSNLQRIRKNNVVVLTCFGFDVLKLCLHPMNLGRAKLVVREKTETFMSHIFYKGFKRDFHFSK